MQKRKYKRERDVINLKNNSLLIKFLQNETFINLHKMICYNYYESKVIKKCLEKLIINKKPLLNFVENNLKYIISLKNPTINDKDNDELIIKLISETNNSSEDFEKLIDDLIYN